MCIRHDLSRFGLLYSHRRLASDTNFFSRGRQLPNCLAPAPRPFAVAPRGRSFPPEDRPHPSGPTEILLYNLDHFFSAGLARLHEERRYHVFVVLETHHRSFSERYMAFSRRPRPGPACVLALTHPAWRGKRLPCA